MANYIIVYYYFTSVWMFCCRYRGWHIIMLVYLYIFENDIIMNELNELMTEWLINSNIVNIFILYYNTNHDNRLAYYIFMRVLSKEKKKNNFHLI